MSAKRQAENQLGPDNWDEEEPVEKEEDGGFKMAPKEILEKRVIRTAKRRSQATGDGAQKSIFSRFSGFNKTPKSSFAFLENLTNGSKINYSNSLIQKSDTAAVASSSVVTKTTSNPSSGMFTMSNASTPITNSAFGPFETTIFGGTVSTPAITQSVFTTSKPDSTVNDLFKVPSSSTTFSVKSKANPDETVSQVTSTLFGSSANNNSSFSTMTNSTPVFKIPVINSSKSTEVNLVDKSIVKAVDTPVVKAVIKPDIKAVNTPDVKSDDTPVVKTVDKQDKSVDKQDKTVGKPVVKTVEKVIVKDEKELIYYNNLKGLNESVSEWIMKHVKATPLCILTPIFKDYENHLKDIQNEYDKSKQQSLSINNSNQKDNRKETNSHATLSSKTSGSTLFSNANITSSNSVLAPSTTSSVVGKTTFNFGIKTPTTTITSSTNIVTAATPSTGFTFGIRPTNDSTAPVPTNTTVPPFPIITTSPIAATTIISPFAATPDTSPFAATPATSPFATTTTTSPFAATPATSPFSATKTTSPFAVTTTNSPLSATTTTSPFANTTTVSPLSATTITSRFASSKATSLFSATATTSSFAATTTISPFAATTTTSLFDATTTTSPFAASTTTSLFDATTTTFPFMATTSTSPFAASTTISPFAVTTTTSLFATNTTTSPFAANNGSTPFSFGIGKPFAFNSNIKNSDEPANECNDNEDEPPKVEYTPIKEENSVYDKKCKIFVKKDGNFIDKGVGTLYIKKIEETGKYQLLVRANTSLGNVLINMILSASLPTQRMGKNNVMMVCIPTPDAQPPPTSILIRVKTSEDADELLETLNKLKA